MSNYKNVLLDAMLYAMEGEDPSRAIEDQERREAQEAVQKCHLPRIAKSCVPHDVMWANIPEGLEYREERKLKNANIERWVKSQYALMGINVLDVYDDLMFEVELPEGWEMRRTSHPMWNEVFDGKSRKRIQYFYKGAFYDRDSFSNFCVRYGFEIAPFDDYKNDDVDYEKRQFKPWTLYITDCGERIETLKVVTATTKEEYYKNEDDLREMANNYLNENYPKWKDFRAYWG